MGRLADPYAVLEQKLLKRIRSACSLHVQELKEVKDKNKEQQKIKEAALIEKHIDPSDTVILMDKDGRHFSSSEDFAGFLKPISQPAFVIGSDVGLHASLKSRADQTVSFSRLTFPHQLFRIMLYEQIYRAQCIWSNHPYHK